MASSFTRFLDHTRATVDRTSLEEWSARRRDLYLTTLKTGVHAPGGIRTHKLGRRAAVDLPLRPHSNGTDKINALATLIQGERAQINHKVEGYLGPTAGNADCNFVTIPTELPLF